MRGLEKQHQVSNKERTMKLRLLNLKNGRHRRNIIKAFRYIEVWWKETGNKLFSVSLVHRERSKLKQGRFNSDIKENSLNPAAQVLLITINSPSQFSTTNYTDSSWEGLYGPGNNLWLLKTALLPRETRSKLHVKESVSQYTDSAAKLLPKVPVSLLLWPLARSPLPVSDALSVASVQWLQSCTMHQYSEMSQLENNPGFGRFVLRGL